MSRLLSKMVKAPAVGMSSKAMMRSNSSADADAGRPADLHGLRVAGAAILQHLADADAERVFVDARAARNRRTPRGSWSRPNAGADAGVPVAAVQRDQRRGGEGLDVVDDGRLVEIAVGHRERRPVARGAALAFERFDQRRLLAADVGTGADVDLDVEIGPRNAEDVVAQQVLAAAMPPARR
jgi:hypothetical protein